MFVQAGMLPCVIVSHPSESKEIQATSHFYGLVKKLQLHFQIGKDKWQVCESVAGVC